MVKAEPTAVEAAVTLMPIVLQPALTEPFKSSLLRHWAWAERGVKHGRKRAGRKKTNRLRRFINSAVQGWYRRDFD